MSCAADGLDTVGRVIDFGAIKSLVGEWLDAVFDHGFVAELGDPIVGWLREHGQKFVVINAPPTVENLVELWFDGATSKLAEAGIVTTRLRAYETPNCFADYDRMITRRTSVAILEEVR